MPVEKVKPVETGNHHLTIRNHRAGHNGASKLPSRRLPFGFRRKTIAKILNLLQQFLLSLKHAFFHHSPLFLERQDLSPHAQNTIHRIEIKPEVSGQVPDLDEPAHRFIVIGLLTVNDRRLYSDGQIPLF